MKYSAGTGLKPKQEQVDEEKQQVETPRWRIPQWFPDLSPEVLERLKVYHVELLKFTKMMNLISRHTVVNADQVHFADAIAAARLIFQHSHSQHIFDVGSGNGIPGLVMASLDPERVIYCVDSNAKKSEAIRHFATRMGLTNVKVYNARFEDLGEGTIDCAVSRGFASISKSLLLSRKALKVGGRYYHMKSSNWATELGDIPTQMFRHWIANDHFDYAIPESDMKMSVVVTKKNK